MATMSSRSMSATLRPLSEMWDESGRIRPAEQATRAPIPTAEEQVRVENVRMTAAKQKEVAADEKRNTDIETFLTNPELVAGATVRKAGFGTREFTFGGQRAYTYSASQDEADHKELSRLDDRKTFAELLTVDMPGKLAVAGRLWAEGGDRDGAASEIGAIDAFVSDNYDTLVTLTKYNGQNPLAADIAARARSMVSGAYKTPFLTMERDPEIKAAVARKQALDTGFSGDAVEAFEKAAKGDAWSRTLLDAAGTPATLDAKAGVAGKGATPQAARAAAVGVDPSSASGFVSFANKADLTLRANLGADYDSMVLSDRASAMKSAYDAGPAAADAVLSVASGAAAASQSTGQDRLNVFKSGVKNAAGFMTAWGRADDPAWSSLGARALKGISEVAPEGVARQPGLVARAGADAARELTQYRAMGVDIPDAKVPSLAKVIYARNAGNVSILSDEDKRMSALMTEAEALKSNVDVSRDPILDEQAKAAGKQQAETPLGMEIMQSAVKGFIHKASGVAMANGVPLRDAMKSQAAELATDIASLAGLPEETARDAAVLLTGVLAKDGAVDLRSLPEYIRQSIPKPVQDQSLTNLAKTPQGRAEIDKTVVQRLGGEASYDAQVFQGLRGVPVSRKPVLGWLAGGGDEFSKVIEKVQPVATRIAADAVSDMLWATKSIAAMTAADVDPAQGRDQAVDKLGTEYVDRLRKLAPRVVAQASDEDLKALGVSVASQLLDKAATVIPVGYEGTARRFEDLLGGTVSAVDRLQRAVVEPGTGYNPLAGELLPGGLSTTRPSVHDIRLATSDFLTKATAKAALGDLVPAGAGPVFGTAARPEYAPANQKEVALRAQDYALRAFAPELAPPTSAQALEEAAARALPVSAPGSTVSFPAGRVAEVAAEPPRLPFDTAVKGFELARAVGGLERLRTRLEKPVVDAVTRQYVREDFYKQALADGVPAHEAARMRAQLARGALAKVGFEDLQAAGYAAINTYTKTAAASAQKAKEDWEKFKADLKAQGEAMVAGETNETSAGQK